MNDTNETAANRKTAREALQAIPLALIFRFFEDKKIPGIDDRGDRFNRRAEDYQGGTNGDLSRAACKVASFNIEEFKNRTHPCFMGGCDIDHCDKMKENFNNSGVSPLFTPKFNFTGSAKSQEYMKNLKKYFNDKRGCFFFKSNNYVPDKGEMKQADAAVINDNYYFLCNGKIWVIPSFWAKKHNYEICYPKPSDQYYKLKNLSVYKVDSENAKSTPSTDAGAAGSPGRGGHCHDSAGCRDSRCGPRRCHVPPGASADAWCS